MALEFKYDTEGVDWNEVESAFAAAFGRSKEPDQMKMAFENSMFKCFLYENNRLVAFGRAIADGIFAAYVCDIAVLPECQGKGYGKLVVSEILKLTSGHKKVILYANPGKEGFYSKLGFKKMNTAMAIFKNEDEMLKSGVLSDETC